MKQLIFIFLICGLTLISGAEAYNKIHVLIDPGHGGYDKGATTRARFRSDSSLIKESDLTLSLSQKILNLIHDKYDHAIEAEVTRNGNQFISLSQRIEKAQNPQIDLYISLHYNSASSEALSGTEVYFPQSQKLDEDLSVLDAIKQDVIETGRIKKSLQFSQQLTPEWTISPLKIRRASFYILDKSPVPSILIEVGYLSNPREQKKLLNLQSQDMVAESIVKALLNFKENRDNPLN